MHKQPRSSVLIVFTDGKLRKVRVVAPALTVERTTRMAVQVARELEPFVKMSGGKTG